MSEPVRDAPRPLSALRNLIDGVDVKLVQLLNERAKLVMEVGRRKAVDGTPVYAPHREQAVLAKVLHMSTGPMLNVTLEAIYKEIMSGSFALERPLRIGYLGPAGSFTHEAAVRQFGNSVSYENLRTIDGVFEEVGRGHVDYGLVPVENSLVGSVGETLGSFLEHCGPVSVCAEVQLCVSQALIATPGAVPKDIQRIFSKPEALGQCQKWIATQYPQAELITTTSTSAAVELVANAYAKNPEDARGLAAIGSKLAAQLYDLPVMFPEVQDVTPNITRFLVLCSCSTAAAVSTNSGDDKTSILFVCQDRPGALRDVLDGFAKYHVNLTHIEKRPCPPPMLAKLVAVKGNEAKPYAEPVEGVEAPSIMVNGRVTPPTTMIASEANLLPPSLLVPSLTGGRGSVTLPFVYAFFVEATGHITSSQVADAVREIAEHCVCVKILGSFPKARRVL